MLTVPQAAAQVGREPETIRRWIRSGKLRARKVGTQHLIDEDDLQALVEGGVLRLPKEWTRTSTGEPVPNVVAAIRRSRAAH